MPTGRVLARVRAPHRVRTGGPACARTETGPQIASKARKCPVQWTVLGNPCSWLSGPHSGRSEALRPARRTRSDVDPTPVASGSDQGRHFRRSEAWPVRFRRSEACGWCDWSGSRGGRGRWDVDHGPRAHACAPARVQIKNIYMRARGRVCAGQVREPKIFDRPDLESASRSTIMVERDQRPGQPRAHARVHAPGSDGDFPESRASRAAPTVRYGGQL